MSSAEMDSENPGLFILPEGGSIIVQLHEEYTFVVADHITAGLGTVFNKVELL